ncbi:MAG: sulfatase [Opitutaceae bacterium]|nr:sulfatase [Opitutaceae bacterium]|tara:strand:+ start:1587 stop:2987 length:1401 start_codon:yes stop_codon:yes gene_type:complete
MERPNILFFCTDQQRFDTIGALGNPHVKTPRIDEFVEEGTAFTQAYCQSPICTPSRSSFMTGLYPSRVHNTRNGNDTFPADAPPLISKLLADVGYVCGNIGKFHLTSSAKRTELRLENDGYSYWKFSHAPRDDWETGHDYGDWVREQGGDLDAMRKRPERVDPELHQTKWAKDCCIEFIEQNADQSWFLTVNIYDPHPPLIPPKVYADQFDLEEMPGSHNKETDRGTQEALEAVDFQAKYSSPEELSGKQEQALYYAMIKQIDVHFGHLMDFLEASGQKKNTLVIFTSDHGEMLGDHGLLWKGCRFYEGLVRVPLIFSLPGRVRTNQVADGLVELLDLSATVLDYAGVEIPDYFQGRTLRPILEGQSPGDSFRDSVRCEYFNALDKFFTGKEGSFATMYRDRRYKLCIYHNLALGELYDLREDPWEHENLWDSSDHQQLKDELIFKSFNQHVMLSTDVGSPRIAPY